MKAFRGEQQSLSAEAVIQKVGIAKPVLPDEVEKGLLYNYTHGIYRMVNDFQNVPPLKSGVIPTFSIEPREKDQFFSFDYSGYISIPQDGTYTFYLASNDGGRLYVDDRQIINNDGLHPVVEVNKSVKLKAGLHPLRVKYFQEGGRNGLIVSWQGPGITKQEIQANSLFHKK